jgi:thymidylate synthase ThyX
MTQPLATNVHPDATTSAGSDIFIVDNLHPEAVAMAQALYSRDPRSVATHLEKIAESGYEKFMATYYVGYGHKSIGDCGTTTIFAENISILAAKAIQDWRLYNGQEASTRYLDMAAQTLVDPVGTAESKGILDGWMDFYKKSLEALVPHLTEKFPIQEGEKQTVYEKAIKAKAFDIARGLLPAAVKTYASWHTNLRQAHDHLYQMTYHPLEEIRELAKTMRDSLIKKYPSSFSHKDDEAEQSYTLETAKLLQYPDTTLSENYSYTHNLDTTLLESYKKIIAERPRKAELPSALGMAGTFTFNFYIDFGSYRDLQRHRSAILPMPLLTTAHGFHEWYINELPQSLQQEARDFIKAQSEKINNLPCDAVTKQYYCALGFNVACTMNATLPAALYIAEIRSGQTVHPTLRKIAQLMGASMKEVVPYAAVHCDMSDDIWNTRRGTQDIVKKQ